MNYELTTRAELIAEIERLKASVKSTHEHVDVLAEKLTTVRTNLAVVIAAGDKLTEPAEEKHHRAHVRAWARACTRARLGP